MDGLGNYIRGAHKTWIRFCNGLQIHIEYTTSPTQNLMDYPGKWD